MTILQLSNTFYTNRHPTTGVRYTIYHINNDLHPDVWDDIYAYGGEPLEQVDARSEVITKAAEALRDLGFSKWAIERCLDELVVDFDESYECDEPTYEGETRVAEGTIKWRTTWLGGAPHLFVFESPYYGVGRECSPCVPGAVDGGTIKAIFRDDAAAEAHRYHHDEGGPTRSCVGYCLPTTWLRDAADGAYGYCLPNLAPCKK